MNKQNTNLVLSALDHVTENDICKEKKYVCEESGLFCFNGMIADLVYPTEIETAEDKERAILDTLDEIYDSVMREPEGEYVLVCDIEEEHEHKDDCFERDNVLICGIEENHVHDDDQCYEWEEYDDSSDNVTKDKIDKAHLDWIDGAITFSEAVAIVKDAIVDDEY